MYRLQNPVLHYPWGSPTALPEFLRARPDGRPYAELWMGTHPLAPSRAELAGGRTGPLEDVAGGRLPYLLKVLTADRPLSLQVHPHRAMARSGFADEEARGVPLGARERSFKDPHHKPEMVVALTPFESLVGFRPTAELGEILPAVGAPLTDRLAGRLRADPGFAGIVRLLGVLLSTEEPVPPVEVAEVIRACAAHVARGTDPGRAFSTAVEIASWHPHDPGVVASLLLNRVSLRPGEAAFLAHGIIHAHLGGTCLEVAACSDNVLRAGLTDKHIQREALLGCLQEGMSDTFRIEPKQHDGTEMFLPPVEEFALTMTRREDASAEPSHLPGEGLRIVLCTAGQVVLRGAGGAGTGMSLARGEAVFVPTADGELVVTGAGALAQAYTP